MNKWYVVYTVGGSFKSCVIGVETCYFPLGDIHSTIEDMHKEDCNKDITVVSWNLLHPEEYENYKHFSWKK